jgi:hypothetical protein
VPSARAQLSGTLPQGGSAAEPAELTIEQLTVRPSSSFSSIPLALSWVAGAMATAVTPAVAAEQVVTMQGFCFRSPLPLSTPAKAGTDALLVVHPPAAEPGKELFSLLAVRFPLVVTDTKAGMTPAELREYVRGVFLAAAPRRDGESTRRRLLGEWVEGETFTTSIPAPSFGELFVLRRREGDSVVLGFKVRREWSEPGRALIGAISGSLREGEEACGTALHTARPSPWDQVTSTPFQNATQPLMFAAASLGSG